MSVGCSKKVSGPFSSEDLEEVTEFLDRAQRDPETGIRTIPINDARFSTLMGVLRDCGKTDAAKSEAEAQLKESDAAMNDRLCLAHFGDYAGVLAKAVKSKTQQKGKDYIAIQELLDKSPQPANFTPVSSEEVSASAASSVGDEYNV